MLNNSCPSGRALPVGREEQQALPSEDVLSSDDDAQATLADQLDAEHYRDDILRLLFICCHPDLPATLEAAVQTAMIAADGVLVALQLSPQRAHGAVV